MRYPEFLKENGTIGFIAPSFGCATEPYISCFNEAEKNFEGLGYKIVEGPNCRVAVGDGKSNTPEKCGEEVNDFFVNDRSDVIISCGGGELMCEDLPFIDFAGIARAKAKWYMGYSDNTNLTFLLPTLCDTAAIYGPCASEFGTKPRHKAVSDAFDVITGKKLTVSNYDGWESEQIKCEENPLASYNINEEYKQVLAGNKELANKFSGRLIGGCMDVLSNLVGTKFDKVTEFNEKYKKEGIIWFLEACDFNSMSVRRALWQMEQAGWFKEAKAFLIGRPVHYDDCFGDFDMHKAVEGILSKYNVPIIMDLDIGHMSPQMPLISGCFAEVSTGSNNISIEMKLI